MAGDHELYGLLLDMAVRERNEVALKKYLEMAEETAKRCEHPLFQAIAARARGVSHRLAGDSDEALRHLEEAMTGFRQLDTRWQIGRTLVELAELEDHRDNGSSAQELMAEALAIFEELGAKPDASKVLRKLAEI
jgi:tetratricopeptide (TPR) repeat protein